MKTIQSIFLYQLQPHSQQEYYNVTIIDLMMRLLSKLIRLAIYSNKVHYFLTFINVYFVYPHIPSIQAMTLKYNVDIT